MNKTSNAAEVVQLETAEQQELDREVSVFEQKANEVSVESDADYAYAGELLQQVKQIQKKAKAYWKPMHDATYRSYKAVLNHEKQMVAPTEKAEKILKGKMSVYSVRKERERRAREEEMRRQAREEAEQKLAEAMAAEEKGDTAAADYAMAEAEMMDNVADHGAIPEQRVKAEGISQRKDWVITGIDYARVPVSVEGTLLRPVDEGAVRRLIKSRKGQVQIPGVTFEETVSISAR